MKKVLLDTNALMAIAEFHLDLISELKQAGDFTFKIVVLEGSIQELQKIIREQRGKYQQAARIALTVIAAQKIEILPAEGNVDDLLTAYSRQGCLVLTQDTELKKLLTKPYLTIRQKKKVILIK